VISGGRRHYSAPPDVGIDAADKRIRAAKFERAASLQNFRFVPQLNSKALAENIVRENGSSHGYRREDFCGGDNILQRGQSG
jgi:hypothetical protein